MTSENGNASLREHFISWAKGQPYNNLLLSAIFAVMCWTGHYAVTVAIPSHLKQIQEGYREITVDMQERHQQEREQAIKTYDRWIEWIREDNAARKGRPAGDASPSMLATPDSR